MNRSLHRPAAWLLSCVAALGGTLGCSSDLDGAELAATGPRTAGPRLPAPPPRARPAGPVADLTQELAGGKGPFLAAADGSPLPQGYVDHEYVASGMAVGYDSGPNPLSEDGVWSLQPTAAAPFRTRVFVRRPADMSRASGTVLVEWLNVSGGADANPDYASFVEEVVRKNHVWVGVSAQLIGVEGGPVLVGAPSGEGIAGQGLKGLDPERYGSLQHPGDGYAFDIYTQVARALAQGGAPLGGVLPEVVLAVGESQSAAALTTYYNGMQPVTQVFDGFLIHSRGASHLGLAAPGESADLAGSIMSGTRPVFRADVAAPILNIQTEGDVTGVLSSSAVHQPDADRYRLWEVAGAAHADVRLVGTENAARFDCGAPINDGPMHLVVKAALRALDTWVRTRTPPPTAPRLELVRGPPAMLQRSADGIALGGIRTPLVDVPVDVLSGAPGPNSQIICILLGSTKPLPPERIAALYPTRAVYMERFNAEADKAIAAGFVLQEDREALLKYAKPDRVNP